MTIMKLNVLSMFYILFQ